MFKKATKAQAKARLLFSGASGSGKTTAALTVAAQLGKKIAFIDTEAGSASLYADRFDFDVLELSPPYAPERFIEAIEALTNGVGQEDVSTSKPSWAIASRTGLRSLLAMTDSSKP
jgi:DNA polymerase III delta prime subunit